MNYTIQSGDTLTQIASQFGTTVQALLKANPTIADRNFIRSGDSLEIPDDIVKVSGIDDPATNDADATSPTEVNEVVQSCPLQQEWFTIKPICYAVSDKGTGIALPDSLETGAQMPALSEHDYIGRELDDHTVYLYNRDDSYLLEVQYQNGIAESGRCVFGTPPDEVSATLPLLKQGKDSRVVMWLTTEPLTDLRLRGLEAYPDLISLLGQRIDFSLAACGNAPDTSPLFDLEALLAEVKARSTLLQWSAKALEPISDLAGLVAPYQVQTPDNHFVVCLVDAVGIASDLCREFSIAYETVMSSIGSSQHPVQMARLTKHLIDNEAQKTRDKVRTSYYHQKEGYTTYFDQETVDERRNEAEADRREELGKLLYLEEMEQYLTNQEAGLQKLKATLEALAEDWLTWLEHDQLDRALAWLDDTDAEQVSLKEALVVAMTNNIEATDRGVQLRNRWVETLVAQAQGKKTQENGAGAHLISALGFAWKATLEGSKWLKELNGTSNHDSSVHSMVQARQALLNNGGMPATLATDMLVQTLAVPLVETSLEGAGNALVWTETYTLLTLRYGYQYRLVNANLGDVIFDLEVSYAVMVATATGNIVKTPIRETTSHTLSLYDLDQHAKPDKSTTGTANRQARYLAKMVLGSGMLEEKGAVMKLYRSTEKAFSPSVQKGTVGLFALVQIYNLMQITSTVENDGMAKAGYDRINSFVAVATASFAAIDQFAGARFGSKGAEKVFQEFMKGEGAELLGNKVRDSLGQATEELGYKAAQTIETRERIGRRVTTITRGFFRWLPVVGNLLAFTGSGLQGYKDWEDGQNAGAKALSIMSMVANGAALVVGLAALVPAAAPVMAVLAVILALTALAVELLRLMVADDLTELLLKGSLWGRAQYRYSGRLRDSSLSERLKYFSNASGSDMEVIKSIKSEMSAFSDALFRPIPQLIELEKEGDLSRYRLQILLPGFIPLTSDIRVLFQGVIENDKKTLLLSHSRENQWQVNRLDGRMEMLSDNLARLSLTIDEAVLKYDYVGYELALEYHKPVGYPVVLKYPKITIDDNKSFFEFWRSQTELEAFELHKEHA